MKLFPSIVALSTMFLLTAYVLVINPAKANSYIKKELTLSAQQLKRFNLTTGAGSLTIHGKKNLNEIKLTANIYTNDDDLDGVQLSLTSKNQQANLIAKIKSEQIFWQGNSPYIDIVILVPANLLLTINDGSGNIKIDDMKAAINLTDGSGSIEISTLNGNINLHDGSGGIYVKNIQGNIDIVDGSGELEIKNIRGNVNIDDGSGDILVKNIQGNIDIVDGSGALIIKNITQKVVINDGSGDIEINNVGQLKIIESGSGSVYLDNISIK